MKQIHPENVPWFKWTSPAGKFARASREVSEALDAVALSSSATKMPSPKEETRISIKSFETSRVQILLFFSS
jgi:hypothetical protein